MTVRFVSAALVAISLAAGMPAGTAFAQDDDALLEEILVTARKREESLLEIPVAITAFSRDDILAADIDELADVGNLSAGFQFFNQGNQQPGRYNTQLQFRGLTTAQFSPSFATGALFIDGVYVLNGGTSLSMMDVERIEVIKGPQAAYFGRNTFGGAVNLITRDPNASEFGGEVNFTTTNRSNNDLSFFLEGPIVSEQLAFSLSGRFYDKAGHYVATDGGRLGNEETTAINAVLAWQPTDALSFKLRYSDSEDQDGAPAAGFISGIVNDSCTGTTIDSPEGPANPVRYICGEIPGPGEALTKLGTAIISSNTFLPASHISAGITNPATLPAGVPQVDEVGMKRETERASLTINYDINDYNVEFIAGFNEQGANWIRDFDIEDRVNFFSRDPQYMEDDSLELRLTSPQDGRFRWLVGVNRYTQEFTSSGGGGDASVGCFDPGTPVLTDEPTGCLPFTLLFPNTLANTDEAEVFGVFAAADFDITENLTLIVEGRFQEDEITKGQGLTTPGAEILTETFDDFLPRIILRYQPNDDTNLYVSYSEGQIAGDFNSLFINADQRERDQYLAAEPALGELLPAETLEAIELGWKQVFLDGRAQVNVALYHNEWDGIKGRSSVSVNETCRAGDIDNDPGCDSSLGIGVGDPKQIDNGMGMLIPLFNSRNILLPGDGEITGLEVESLFAPTENVLLGLNLSYIDSEYADYKFNFVQPVAGFSIMTGNKTPRQPEWTASAFGTVDFEVAGMDAYVRGDLNYQGKSFVDESNLAFIEAFTTVNLRGGVETEDFRVELFIRNLTDEDAWQTAARWTDFASPFQLAFFTAKQGIAVTPLDRREIGVRASFYF